MNEDVPDDLAVAARKLTKGQKHCGIGEKLRCNVKKNVMDGKTDHKQNKSRDISRRKKNREKVIYHSRSPCESK